MPILDVPLKEHILAILQEAGMENFGDLMLQVKRDPDKILSLNGIGPKAMEEIQTLVQTYQFPSLETVPEPVAEEAPALEESATAAVVEGGAEAVVSEVEAEAVEAPAVETVETPAIVEEPAAEEKSFEELFKLESLHREEKARELVSEDEDSADQKQDKKGKGKKKKGYTVEYDPDKEEEIVRYKHKKDGDWTEDW